MKYKTYLDEVVVVVCIYKKTWFIYIWFLHGVYTYILNKSAAVISSVLAIVVVSSSREPPPYNGFLY